MIRRDRLTEAQIDSILSHYDLLIGASPSIRDAIQFAYKQGLTRDTMQVMVRKEERKEEKK